MNEILFATAHYASGAESMSNSVWVIEQGSYSDYRVVGVYTSKENAEIVCDEINKSDSYEQATIAEWPLNPGSSEINQGLSQWLVHMRRDGFVERCNNRSLDSYDLSHKDYVWQKSKASAFRDSGAHDVLVSVVFASDGKHAIKSANERRLQMIAMNKWKAA
jgi:hypothetical protein